MNSEMTVKEIASSDFLTCWNSLANSKTCPELKAIWSAITEQAVLIDPRGLNELWDFYLDRLGECEREKP